ncbi:MAG: hypothetical protein J6J21_05970 [Clostridia bacterium]|nr:hypothetical protein [Clostridia bacterium]
MKKLGFILLLIAALLFTTVFASYDFSRSYFKTNIKDRHIGGFFLFILLVIGFLPMLLMEADLFVCMKYLFSKEMPRILYKTVFHVIVSLIVLVAITFTVSEFFQRGEANWLWSAFCFFYFYLPTRVIYLITKLIRKDFFFQKAKSN